MSRRYQRKPGVHLRNMDDQVFLADPDTNVLFHLNAIGGAVWRLLEDAVAVDDIVDVLNQAFPDVGRDRLYADITALIDNLARHELIIVCGDTPSGR